MSMSARDEVLTDLLNCFEERLPDSRALVAIDGFDGAGKTHLAHELSALAERQQRRPMINVSIDDFHLPKAARYRNGRGPESFYRDSYDYPAFMRAVVKPLRAGDPIIPGIWHVDRDEPLHRTPVHLPRNVIVLVDGIFLHRPELAGVWDASVWVNVPFRVSVPRGNARFAGEHDPDPEAPGNARYVGGQRLYLAEADPEHQCTWVLDNTDLQHPRFQVH